MRNNCLFILLIAVFVLSGCGKNDNVKTAIGIAEMVRQYETMKNMMNKREPRQSFTMRIGLSLKFPILR